jgi:protein gp37
MLSEGNWQRPLKWNRDAGRAGVPGKVFCASMADVFEDHPDLEEPRKRLWDLIEATPWLHWQLLTKRPENVAAMAPWGSGWPSWVWLGVSAENQRWADTRIPVLLELPAAVRSSARSLCSARSISGSITNAATPTPDMPGCGGLADHRRRAAPGRGLCSSTGPAACWPNAVSPRSAPSRS